MPKLRLFVIVLCLLLAGCSKNQNMTFDNINRQLDEASGTENNLWFVPANFSVSSFDIKYGNNKLVYTWTFTFNEKFYQKLLITKPQLYYRLLFPKEVSNILKVKESDYFQLQPIETNGKRKYAIELPLNMDKKLSDEEIELIRNNLDYNLMIYNENFKAISMLEINKLSTDRTIYFK
ncbi:hypothetical protein [Paenibacillus chibensis]|uniref:hypothetical protein n=1 Tax=Paenibacillus chibensis TaxID=59846 RepID=UPI000FD8260B|nr:hypothetical protein [Paenibacillus chibensis]MEC0371819.1 hypothetical protein [Paenibacillus chibensis]